MTRAFAPGRVNLIGEHTDYNGGLSLPFAVRAGVRVDARPRRDATIVARSHDLGEDDAFAIDRVEPARGWRAFVRGAVAELRADGHDVAGADLDIAADLPRGAGLSSSAALCVALCLALLGPDRARAADPRALARACSRVEHRWVGARTGLLDQLASLLGRDGHALRIDFSTLAVEPVPLALGDWRLLVADSGESHDLAASGYNERRAECAEAAEVLGVEHLAQARLGDLGALPEPLDRRARHVLAEDARVDAAAKALATDDFPALAQLLDASHASLRDLYDASTPAVEATVERLREAGAAGARMMGGGFGGSVLALFAPGVTPPRGTLAVEPGPGASVA